MECLRMSLTLRSRTISTVIVVLLLTVAGLHWGPSSARAADAWYVSTSGSDSADCRTAATACATVSGALAKAAAGDTVVIGPGTFAGFVIRRDVTVRGESAEATRVGQVTIWDSAVTAELSAVTVSRPDGTSGGGRGGGIDSMGRLTVRDAVVRGNQVFAGEGYQALGGGVYNGGTMTLSRSTVTGNRAVGNPGEPYSGQGGGIHNAGSLTITASTVDGNVGKLGGGIYNAGTLTVDNSTISGNRALRDGGGLTQSERGTSTLRFVTVAENVGDGDSDGTGDGGGIAALGQTTLVASVLGANDDAGREAPDCSGSVISGGANVVGSGEGCTLAGSGGSDRIGEDPRLGPLAANGGSTLTHALLEGSPAIDLANATACPADDQRGVTRPQGDACDSGAVEFTGNSPVVCPCTLWGEDARPAVLEDADDAAVELGVRFRTEVPGFVTGVRFYKGPGNTGEHTGTLWSSTGERLATGTFADETDSGWQELTFALPVAVEADTTYVASYHTDVGRYAVDEHYFEQEVRRGPLVAPRDGVDGANGVYRYGASAFPDKSHAASNYWVDVRFDRGTELDTWRTIWRPTDVPQVLDDGGEGPVELGVRFRTDAEGWVSGVRFYKGPGDTGAHTGSLWSSEGKRLATGSFRDETASGWQEMSFATPVPVEKGATYTASYHTDVGRYAVTETYFEDDATRSGPLEALQSSAESGNGVYAYGPSAFPTRSHRSSNYWVDVRFRSVTAGLARDLGTLGGESSEAYAVNTGGVIVGTSTTVQGQALRGRGARAFVWRDGRMTALQPLAAGPDAFSTASDVNDRAEVVGDSRTPAGHRHAVLWWRGAIRDLGALGGEYSTAAAVNNRGDVAGTSTTRNGQLRAFLWRKGRMTDLGTLGGPASAATGVNERGDVSGYAQLPNQQTHAVVWRNGKVIDLGGLPGGSPSVGTGVLSQATDVGARRDVVGWGFTAGGSAAAVWRDGKATGLPPLRDGQSWAARVNADGLVVGSGRQAADTHAVAWWDGAVVDLGSRTAGASSALGVSDSAVVVGRTVDARGHTRATAWVTAGLVPTRYR
jgi:probable HAF family extracellular repeat protein